MIVDQTLTEQSEEPQGDIGSTLFSISSNLPREPPVVPEIALQPTVFFLTIHTTLIEALTISY